MIMLVLFEFVGLCVCFKCWIKGAMCFSFCALCSGSLESFMCFFGWVCAVLDLAPFF